MIHGKGISIEFTDTLEYADGTPVQVIRFAHKMDVLSSAIYNGGRIQTDCILIMQVSKDYMSADPHHDVQEMVDILGLPKETVGLMTAAEVEYVFNVCHHEHGGKENTFIIDFHSSLFYSIYRPFDKLWGLRSLSLSKRRKPLI